MSREELDELRKVQQARGEKPRYDGRWRPGHRLKVPEGIKPVVRFLTPQEGEVGWNDLVKGPISFPNKELDDLVILRADGVPTYNFGVVVDDLDMGMTHVIRGDDHVNNTPRQIHIFNALGKPLPAFGHLPMILGADGERLSKRHGAVNVMQYREEGFLPEALLNYLARLGWSHGDDEVFSMQQMVEWFDLGHVSRSPAKFDPEKALWMNQQYIKKTDNKVLAGLVLEIFQKENVPTGGNPALESVVALVKDRAHSIPQIADAAKIFYVYDEPDASKIAANVRAALAQLLEKLKTTPWDRKSLGAAVSEVVKASGLKMPELAMPARLLVTGRSQTPSLDAVLELLGRETVIARLARHLG
jgi:glutamyl-tRNA synthetase